MTRYEFLPLLQKQAASIVQMDLSITGGISETRKIDTMAETHYAHTAPHVWGGPLAAAAAIHVEVSSPNFLIQEGIELFSEFHREILKEPIVWEAGCIIPPTAPGLGYGLNDERIPHTSSRKHSRLPDERNRPPRGGHCGRSRAPGESYGVFLGLSRIGRSTGRTAGGGACPDRCTALTHISPHGGRHPRRRAPR